MNVRRGYFFRRTCECCASADWVNGWLCCHAYGLTLTRHAVRRAHHCPDFCHIGWYAVALSKSQENKQDYDL